MANQVDKEQAKAEKAQAKEQAKAAKAQAKAASKGGGPAPVLCNVLGTLLIVAVIGLCVPLTVPILMGYDLYEVVSGSMEPEIPIGSAAYVKEANLGDVQEGEIIAFNEGGSVIVHRVVTNRTSLGEFVTKGDANNVQDLEPIPYENVIGVVQMHIPGIGAFMSIYASTVGKVYLLLIAACGVMLNVLAGRMRVSRRQRAALLTEQQKARAQAAARGAAAADDAYYAAAGIEPPSSGKHAAAAAAALAEPQPVRRSRFAGLRRALIIVALAVFLGSGAAIGYVQWQYSISDALYTAAISDFTEWEKNVSADKPPIAVNFKALQAKNPDVIGWIYCEDTVINYPVLKGESNDQYLHHDYTGEYNFDGSIFVDAANADDFADCNTIIYGHHMNSGSMFASLVNWAEQDFYEEHSVMWLLTPKQNYKIVIFSAHHTSAYSEMYDIISKPGEELDAFLKAAEEESDITPVSPVLLDANKKYVMLTTCAYLFDNDRYVIHGILQPVS